jgi:F-type H+-transporting ATPase subunit b
MRRVVSAVLALALLLAGPAVASASAEAGGEKAAEGETKKEEHHADHPRELAIDLGVWTVVVFLLLFGLLYWKAWPLMLEGLQKRERAIKAALEEAQRAREESARLKDSLTAQMAEAAQQARTVVEEAHRAATRVQEEMLAKARADIQAERDRLRREMSTAHDQMLKALLDHTADLAAQVAMQVLPRQLGPDDHRRLVDDALAHVREAGAAAREQMVEQAP